MPWLCRTLEFAREDPLSRALHPHPEEKAPAKTKQSAAAGAFEAFVAEFSTERPREGLDTRTPAQVYRTRRKAPIGACPSCVIPCTTATCS